MKEKKDSKIGTFVDKHAEGIATTIVFGVSVVVPVVGFVAYYKWLDGFSLATNETIIEDGVAITTNIAKNGKILNVFKTPVELLK